MMNALCIFFKWPQIHFTRVFSDSCQSFVRPLSSNDNFHNNLLLNNSNTLVFHFFWWREIVIYRNIHAKLIAVFGVLVPIMDFTKHNLPGDQVGLWPLVLTSENRLFLRIFLNSVCNFQSTKSSVELNSFLSKFFCYITWFAISPD